MASSKSLIACRHLGNTTERAYAENRLARAECAVCHGRFEPLAFAFERFDGIGRYRTRDEHGHDLRDDGWIPAAIAGEQLRYANLAQYLALIAGNPVVQQCQSKKHMEFALGRRLAAGDEGVLQEIHGTSAAAEYPVKRPGKLFERLFGAAAPASAGAPTAGGSAAVAAARARARRSILDTVVEEYRFLTGDASYLGTPSRQKLANHLDRIREVERRLAPADAAVAMAQPVSATCAQTTNPGDPTLDGNAYELRGATDQAAPSLSLETFQRVFRLQADLLALGLRCDLVRLGSLLCESSGGHFKFSGTHQALGETLNFSNGNSEHATYWHGNRPALARLCTHMFQTQLAYFLAQLDDRQHPEANGRTVLENAVVVIGTEVGWNHDLSPVFHAVAGGRGRFRSGFYDDAINCVDLYNTILQAFAIPAKVGEKSGIPFKVVPGLLA